MTLAPAVLERASSQRSVVRLAAALLYADAQPKKLVVTSLTSMEIYTGNVFLYADAQACVMPLSLMSLLKRGFLFLSNYTPCDACCIIHAVSVIKLCTTPCSLGGHFELCLNTERAADIYH